MARASNSKGNSGNRSSSSRSRSSGKPMMSQWGDTARDKPLATAAAAAGAVAAGVFLWSKRGRIGDQISRMSEQVSEWAGDIRPGSSNPDFASTDVPSAPAVKSRTNSPRTGSSGSRRGMSETGGGNASIGAHTGSTGIGAAS